MLLLLLSLFASKRLWWWLLLLPASRHERMTKPCNPGGVNINFQRTLFYVTLAPTLCCMAFALFFSPIFAAGVRASLQP